MVEYVAKFWCLLTSNPSREKLQKLNDQNLEKFQFQPHDRLPVFRFLSRKYVHTGRAALFKGGGKLINRCFPSGSQQMQLLIF